MKNPLILVCFGLFVLGVALFLAEMWFSFLSPDVFAKLMITIGALFVVACVAAFLLREKHESERIHSDRLD